MIDQNYVRLGLLLVVGILAGCGESANKIGSTIKGTRVAVIEQAKTLEADKDLKKSTPVLPRQVVNLSWPQAGYDSEHTIPMSEMAALPRVLWKQSIGEGSSSNFKILAHPVVEKGVVFTMDSQGLVRAFETKSGKNIWEYDTTPADSEYKSIAGGLAVDGGVLYVTTGFGDVIALNSKSGTLKWKRPLLKPLRAAPSVSDDRVYVVSIDNELTALNAMTGNVLWHHDGIAESATLLGAANPAVIGDSVIVAYNSGEIFDLRAQNGRPSWNYSLTSAVQVGALPAIADIRGLPVIDQGRVYAVSHSGRMASIEQRSGDRVWEAEIGGIDTPVIAGDSLFMYGGDSQLLALTRDGGLPMWVKSLQKQTDMSDKGSPRLVWAGPILAGNRLWMVNSMGQLASFSPADGAPVDTLDLGSPIYLTPVIADRTMYVVTDDGTLLALR